MMTDEQMRDLAKECGLDWQRGYASLFADDPTNRYAVLIGEVERITREECARLCEAEAAKWEGDGTPEPMSRICAAAIRAAAPTPPAQGE